MTHDSRDPEYGGPLWVPLDAPDEDGVTTEQAARALADGRRFDEAQATAFFRNRLKAGSIKPYGRSTTDGRRPYLFRKEQVLVAAVLRRLTELGLTGIPVEVATSRLQHWRADSRNPGRAEVGPGLPPPAETPAARLWAEFETGLPFYVALHLRWVGRLGATNCRAYLSLGDGEYFGQRPEDDTSPDPEQPVADLMVPISPLALVLVSRLAKAD
ncbi:hypothetical protein [Phaeovulum sp.]|uniref:hypothetical protein n=1 Tax=Phaeovulum sp. TaxID=2934796 RepID=UPI003562AABD